MMQVFMFSSCTCKGAPFSDQHDHFRFVGQEVLDWLRKEDQTASTCGWWPISKFMFRSGLFWAVRWLVLILTVSSLCHFCGWPLCFHEVLTNFFICNASDTQYGSFFQQSPFDHVYKWDCCTQQVKQLLSPQRFSWEADRSLTHRAPLNSSMYRQLPSCFDLDQFGHTGLHWGPMLDRPWYMFLSQATSWMFLFPKVPTPLNAKLAFSS